MKKLSCMFEVLTRVERRPVACCQRLLQAAHIITGDGINTTITFIIIKTLVFIELHANTQLTSDLNMSQIKNTNTNNKLLYPSYFLKKKHVAVSMATAHS